MRAWPRPRGLEWLWLAAGLALVVHYRWLVDDAFIYFRYVDNLLFLRVGLVYNAGEYVEGFSSPLFALLLVALRALQLAWPAVVLGVGAAAFLAFGYALVVLNRRLAPADAPVWNLPLAVLALAYGPASFFTSGLETPLVQLAAPLFALFLVRPESRGLAAAVGIAPLVRPELALAAALAAAFAWWRTRRFPLVLALAGLAANGGWLLFRVIYYADLLPNTFYLKNETRIGQGLFYVADAASTYHLGWLLLAGAALAVPVARRGGAAALRPAPRLAMAGIALAVAAFVVKVGGTHVHYWYAAFPFCLAACALAGLPERAAVAGGFAGSRAGASGSRAGRVAGGAAVLAVAAGVFASHPDQLSRHPATGGGEHTPIRHVDDPARHRNHPELAFDAAGRNPSIDTLRRAGRRVRAGGYAAWGATTWCAEHYRHPEAHFVHGFGLTDAILARVEARAVKPGHKRALMPLAQDLARLKMEAETLDAGLYERALAEGRAPAWIARNRGAVQAIARKTYNRHELRPNLRLALRFPGPLELPEDAAPPAAAHPDPPAQP